MDQTEADDLIVLDELRELTALEEAEESIRQNELAAERSRTNARVVGHDKAKGWIVQQMDGTLVNNPTLHTTGALGRGQQVDLVRRPDSAAIDAKPIGGGSSLSSSTGGSTATPKIDSGSGGGFGGSKTNNDKGQYWRVDQADQSCRPVSYNGTPRAGDYASEDECLGSIGLRNWACQDGVCLTVMPGTGKYNSREECEKVGRGGWTIQGGQCVFDGDFKNWCGNGEPRFQTLEECQSSKYKCENGQCIPDPNGQYGDKAACEAALIPAGFTGGQCPNVRYIVNVRIFETPTFSRDYTFGDAGFFIYGPISSIAIEPDPTPGGFPNALIIRAANNLVYEAISSLPTNYTLTILSVVPRDTEPPGGCGDSPGRCPT